ncbi:PP2C family protein-serine/threonine phosphatase [Halomonas sp. WWR20]
MVNPHTLIGLIDQPGREREALAQAIAKGGFAVATADSLAALPAEASFIVAHVRAVDRHDWPRLSERLPTIVVSETRADDDLIKAVDAGLVDYLVEPLEHSDVLRRLIVRTVEHHRLAMEHAEDRARLAELNEKLETHLAMLRLDQQAGSHIQRKLLPPRPVTHNGVTADYWLEPSLYLSGDFLDFQPCDSRYSFFYFADVSGHGASSAFVTVLLRYLCNRWLSRWDGLAPETFPARWLAELNQELIDTGIGKHATVFAGVLDRELRYLHYALGAQLPMPMLQAGEQVTVLEGTGSPVGLFPDVEFPSFGCELPQNFCLWLCSDGVLECLPGETLDARLQELERRVTSCPDIQTLRDSLTLGEELPDDLTMMTLSGFNDA